MTKKYDPNFHVKFCYVSGNFLFSLFFFLSRMRGRNMNTTAAQLLMVSIAHATYNLEAYIRTCDVNGNVTTACYRARIKWCVRLSSIIPLCSKCCDRRAISRRGHVKGQKVTFDLSLLENVRGCNRRATNVRVGTRWLRSSSPLGKLNGTTRMNRSDR